LTSPTASPLMEAGSVKPSSEIGLFTDTVRSDATINSRTSLPAGPIVRNTRLELPREAGTVVSEKGTGSVEWLARTVGGLVGPRPMARRMGTLTIPGVCSRRRAHFAREGRRGHMTRSERLSSIRAWFRRVSPTIASTLGGLAAGVVLVISCNMGPSISMADGTTGGDTSGGSTGGSAGGTSGGSTGGGSGGSCSCSLSGPITLAGPITVAGLITNVPADQNSAQIVSGQLPFQNSAAPGAFDCTSLAQNGVGPSSGFNAECIKLLDGPFILTDVATLRSPGNTSFGTETWLFAAPPSASWNSTTQAQWAVTGGNGLHYLVPAGSSLYAVSDYDQVYFLSFSWSGFKPYQ